jgi:hypothetical protein
MACKPHKFYMRQYGKTALDVAASQRNLAIAAILINHSVEQGTLTVDSFENMSLERAVRDRLSLVFDKAMRRHHRCQVLWMSSDIPTNDRGNILNLLPADLSRSVSNYL